MYFPYLRGKQYELLALKDFSQMSPNNAKIVPIIEPVKNQVNGLNSALETMIKWYALCSYLESERWRFQEKCRQLYAA